MTCFRMSNGESLNKYCEHNCLKYITIWHRIEKGYSLEDAVSKPTRKDHGCMYYYNGKPLRQQININRYRYIIKKVQKGLLKRENVVQYAIDRYISKNKEKK